MIGQDENGKEELGEVDIKPDGTPHLGYDHNKNPVEGFKND